MNTLEDFFILKEVCSPSEGDSYLVCILVNDGNESIHLVPLSRSSLSSMNPVPTHIRLGQLAAQFTASGVWPVDPTNAFRAWFKSFEKEPLVLVHENTKLTMVYVAAWDDSFVNNKA